MPSDHRAAVTARETEEALRQMAESIEEIFWMLDAATLKVIYASPAYEKITGRSVESLHTDPVGYRDVIHPDDRPRVLSRLALLSTTGEFDEEFRIIRPDTTVRWVLVRGFVMRDEHARVNRLTGTALDITDKKLTVEALRNSEANYRSLFERAHYGVFRSTDTGKLLMVNPAFVSMLGYSAPADLLNANLRVDIVQRPREYEAAVNGWCRNRRESIEAHLKRRDGGSILVRMNGWCVENTDCDEQTFDVIAEDVTTQRSLEEQLLRSQKIEAAALLGRTLCYDFNALLAAILGLTERLLASDALSKTDRADVEEILTAALQGREVTQQVLAISRRPQLEDQLLSLNTLIREMEDVLRTLIGESSELSIELAPELGAVRAEASQLQRVVLILTKNARDAIGDRGKITIQTANTEILGHQTEVGLDPGPYVALVVRDNGCGMDEAIQSRIFELFFTTKVHGKGSGLGLSMAHAVVEQSGGRILVQSHVGGGSTFRILLPRVHAIANGLATQRPAMDARETSKTTILLVEDNDVTRRLTAECLEMNGYVVLNAKNAANAIRISRTHPGRIDLLLADVVMPGLWGTDIAGRLRPSRPGMKVLYMTGYGDEVLPGPPDQPINVEVIQKPYLQSELIAKIQAVLSPSANTSSSYS